MPTFSEPLPNSLKQLTEPEQLELFRWSQPTAVCTQVCEQIADVACRFHDVTGDDWASLHKAIVNGCSAGFSSGSFPAQTAVNYTGSYLAGVIGDYINGAATALNAFPSSTAHHGTLHSDRLALSSDWQVVQKDIDQIWKAISAAQTIVESASNERSKQQRWRRSAEETDRTSAT
jgi:hypothetical protein